MMFDVWRCVGGLTRMQNAPTSLPRCSAPVRVKESSRASLTPPPTIAIDELYEDQVLLVEILLTADDGVQACVQLGQCLEGILLTTCARRHLLGAEEVTF